MNEIIARLDKIIELLEAANGAKIVLDKELLPARSTITPSKAVRKRGATVEKSQANSHALIKTYCDAFKLRYGSFPIIEGKTLGLSRYVLQAISLERAQDLVQAFLQMDTKWFLTKGHDFSCFAQNLSIVAVALASGSKNPEDKLFWQNVFSKDNVRNNLRTTSKTPAV